MYDDIANIINLHIRIVYRYLYIYMCMYIYIYIHISAHAPLRFLADSLAMSVILFPKGLPCQAFRPCCGFCVIKQVYSQQ